MNKNTNSNSFILIIGFLFSTLFIGITIYDINITINQRDSLDYEIITRLSGVLDASSHESSFDLLTKDEFSGLGNYDSDVNVIFKSNYESIHNILDSLGLDLETHFIENTDELDSLLKKISGYRGSNSYEWLKSKPNGDVNYVYIDNEKYLINTSEQTLSNNTFIVTITSKVYDFIMKRGVLYALYLLVIILSPLSAWYIYVIVNEKDRRVSQSETILKLVKAHTLISITNEDNVIVFANPKFCERAAYGFNELWHNNHNILNSGEKESWNKLYDITNIEGNIFYSPLIKNIDKNGDPYYVDISVIKNADGKGHTRLSTDLTDLVKQKEDIYEQNKKLQEKNKNIETIASEVNHTLTTEVGVLASSIDDLHETLIDDDMSDTDKLEMISDLVNEISIPQANITTKVLEAIRSLMQLYRKGAKIDVSDTDLTKAVNEYIETAFYDAKIKIDNLGNITTNENLIISMLGNCIKNAVVHNDSEEKKIHIYRENCYICVADNGIGFNHGKLEELCKLDTRDSEFKGTGVGLAYMTQINTALGIEMTTEDNKPKGTIFKFNING